MKPSVSGHLSLGVIFVAALGAAFVFGAWQARHPPGGTAPVDLAAEHSAFVQSGGVVAETDPSVPDATQVFAHTPPPAAPEVAVSTF